MSNTDTKKEEAIWLIFDKYDIELPRHYSGRPRTYSEAKKILDGLNNNGEFGPYKMIPIKENHSQQN